MNKGDIVLEFKNVTKEFPGVTAIDNINLEIKKGEIHGIVGENGAGKSTLCNLIAGIFPPTSGEIYLKGKLSQINHPSQALKEGIALVYQERNLIDSLNGAQNIFLGLEKSMFGGLINDKEVFENAHKLSKSIGMNIVLNKLISEMTPGEMQSIEILRAMAHNPEILVLDEPTSSLTGNLIKSLFQIIKNIQKKGKTVIFISHKLEEIFEICDRISVFRDGKKVSTYKACDIDRRTCIKDMVNRDIANQYPIIKLQTKDKKIAFETKNVNAGEKVKDISIKLYEGEVLGLYGLVGSGRTEFIETIFGIRYTKSGSFILNNEPLRLNHSPRESIRKGIYLIPEDRRNKGVIEIFNLRENASIVFLENITKYLDYVNKKEEAKIVKENADNNILTVKYKDIEQDMDELSGGNKQKIVIMRWLAREGLKLLILDEPTQGIDVGAKQEIYKFVREIAENKNIPIIMISSELPELIGVCDRLYIFKEGIISGELTRDKFDREKILSLAI